MRLFSVIPGRRAAANPEPMNTDGAKRAMTVFMGSGFSPAGCPGMTEWGFRLQLAPMRRSANGEEKKIVLAGSRSSVSFTRKLAVRWAAPDIVWWEVGGGQVPRQPGQVRKEAAVTSFGLGRLLGLPPHHVTAA